MAIGKQSLSRVKNAANGEAASLPQNTAPPTTLGNTALQEIKPLIERDDKKQNESKPTKTIINKKPEIISIEKTNIKPIKNVINANTTVSLGQNLPYYLL